MTAKDKYHDPVFWKHFHGWVVIFLIVTIPVSFLMRDSTPYVVLLSHLALILAEGGSWQASRAEETSNK